jgi:dihydroorotase
MGSSLSDRRQTPTLDLVIRRGRVISADQDLVADIAIRAGRISAVAAPGQLPAIGKEIDAENKIILPGLVDSHAHIPGFFLSTRLDNFRTATAAAAAGGVTTVMLMPTEDPRTINGRYFKLKKQAGTGQSFIDFAIQAVIGPATDRETIDELAVLGAVSFEIFLAYGGDPGFIVGHDDYELARLLDLVKSVDGIAGITPHSRSLMMRLTQIEKTAADKCDPTDCFDARDRVSSVRRFARTRPVASELLGIARAGILAAQSDTRIHLRALSSEASVHLATSLGERADISTEVMSHHLLFDAGEAEAMGPYGVIVPPMRTRADRDHLRAALRVGQIGMVVSDHSPVLREDKDLGWQDIWATAPGMPGFQTLLLSLLHLVDQGLLSLQDVARVGAEVPARRFGLLGRKGRLAPGADADLIILDPKRKTLVSNAKQLSRANYTTLKGRTIEFSIDTVMLRGRPVFANGAVIGSAAGQFIRPSEQ